MHKTVPCPEVRMGCCLTPGCPRPRGTLEGAGPTQAPIKFKILFDYSLALVSLVTRAPAMESKRARAGEPSARPAQYKHYAAHPSHISALADDCRPALVQRRPTIIIHSIYQHVALEQFLQSCHVSVRSAPAISNLLSISTLLSEDRLAPAGCACACSCSHGFQRRARPLQASKHSAQASPRLIRAR